MGKGINSFSKSFLELSGGKILTISISIPVIITTNDMAWGTQSLAMILGIAILEVVSLEVACLERAVLDRVVSAEILDIFVRLLG